MGVGTVGRGWRLRGTGEERIHCVHASRDVRVWAWAAVPSASKRTPIGGITGTALAALGPNEVSRASRHQDEVG